MIVFDWLKWFFSISGIQFTTHKPYQVTLFGKRLFWINRHIFIGYRPDGPESIDLVGWTMMQRFFASYKCKYCGTVVWSYMYVSICESFRCFRKNKALWR